MPVSMTYWPAPSALAHLLDAIYVFRDDVAAGAHLAGALQPQVQWRVSGDFSWVSASAGVQPLPVLGALGPSTSALRIRTADRPVVVGAGLFPEGWAALMPVSAARLIERVVDLTTLWPDTAPPYAERDDDEALAAAFARLLASRLPCLARPDPRIAAISRWADGAHHDIGVLAASLDVCTRQLARISIRTHGLPPRHLANKHKAMRLAAALASGVAKDRTSLWLDEYADQPHFTRAFRRFVGIPPARFLVEPDCLVREVMRARLAIASAHPLGLSPHH